MRTIIKSNSTFNRITRLNEEKWISSGFRNFKMQKIGVRTKIAYAILKLTAVSNCGYAAFEIVSCRRCTVLAFNFCLDTLTLCLLHVLDEDCEQWIALSLSAQSIKINKARHEMFPLAKLLILYVSMWSVLHYPFVHDTFIYESSLTFSLGAFQIIVNALRV